MVSIETSSSPASTPSSPTTPATTTDTKILWTDMSGYYEGGKRYVKIYVPAESVEKIFEINDFDYENQEVTMADGTKNKIVRENGKIVFLNSPAVIPPRDCSINSLTLAKTQIKEGESFQLIIRFSGKCEKWDYIEAELIPGTDVITTSSNLKIGRKLTSSEKTSGRLSLPASDSMSVSEVSDAGHYGFIIRVKYTDATSSASKTEIGLDKSNIQVLNVVSNTELV